MTYSANKILKEEGDVIRGDSGEMTNVGAPVKLYPNHNIDRENEGRYSIMKYEHSDTSENMRKSDVIPTSA